MDPYAREVFLWEEKGDTDMREKTHTWGRRHTHEGEDTHKEEETHMREKTQDSHMREETHTWGKRHIWGRRHRYEGEDTDMPEKTHTWGRWHTHEGEDSHMREKTQIWERRLTYSQLYFWVSAHWQPLILVQRSLHLHPEFLFHYLTNLQLPSVQFSSVPQSCPTLCDPMNCSMPGLPVHHQLLESTQTHVHWVGDVIQPSHPLSSPSPPAQNRGKPNSRLMY